MMLNHVSVDLPRHSVPSCNDSVARDEDSGVVKSAKRVLEVLEYFSECQRPLAVIDIVRGLRYPQSSVSALLKSLTTLGYLNYDRYARLYSPSIRVALLGRPSRQKPLPDHALFDWAECLHHRSGGKAVIVGMQNDLHVQYVHVVQATSPEFYVKPGTMRSMCRTAVGRVLLSLKPDSEIQRVLWRLNASEDPAQRLAFSDLLSELNAVRRLGYAMTFGALNPDTGVIAVRIPAATGEPPMAVGLGGLIDGIVAQQNELLELLRTSVPAG